MIYQRLIGLTDINVSIGKIRLRFCQGTCSGQSVFATDYGNLSMEISAVPG